MSCLNSGRLCMPPRGIMAMSCHRKSPCQVFWVPCMHLDMHQTWVDTTEPMQTREAGQMLHTSAPHPSRHSSTSTSTSTSNQLRRRPWHRYLICPGAPLTLLARRPLSLPAPGAPPSQRRPPSLLTASPQGFSCASNRHGRMATHGGTWHQRTRLMLPPPVASTRRRKAVSAAICAPCSLAWTPCMPRPPTLLPRWGV